jgi:hypothetical protein
MGITNDRKYRREGTLSEDVVTFITRRPGASMAEIMQLAGDEGKGNCDLEFRGRNQDFDFIKNIFIWQGMSEELGNVLTDFQTNELAHMHIITNEMEALMVYLADGMLPTIPMVKRIRKNGYKKPHWIPVVLYPGYKCYSPRLRAACTNYRKGDADRERANVVAEQEETKRVMIELAREREEA